MDEDVEVVPLLVEAAEAVVVERLLTAIAAEHLLPVVVAEDGRRLPVVVVEETFTVVDHRVIMLRR